MQAHAYREERANRAAAASQLAAARRRVQEESRPGGSARVREALLARDEAGEHQPSDGIEDGVVVDVEAFASSQPAHVATKIRILWARSENALVRIWHACEPL